MNDAAGISTGADILYGVAGWSYTDWEGLVYPRGASGETKLLTVASACDMLEVNTTFYRTPPPGMVEAWARRLARATLNTRMVVKINRVFTHEESYSTDDMRMLKEAIAPLDADPVIDRHGIEHPRLLGLLIQFPIFFRLTPENTLRIERLAEDLADWNKVIELRHPSWARPVTFDWLNKHGLSLANLDLPTGGKEPGEKRKPSHAFPREVVATGPLGYLRLHGRNNEAWFDRKAAVDQKYNYLYTPEELSDLGERIRELAGRTRQVAVVGNNHYRGKALATVLNLANLVEGRQATAPETLIKEYPQLAAFTKPLPPPEATQSPPRPARKKPAKRKGDDQPTLF
jgi:uncharacterized protein YecE (DUF72 family)